MKYIKFILLAAALIVFNDLSAQAPTTAPFDSTEYQAPSHVGTSKTTKNQIILRWAPSSYANWDMGNTYGYNIERVVLKSNPNADNFNADGEDLTYKLLPGMPIKPWTIEDFSANIKDSSNRYLGVAMEMLYGQLEAQGDMTKGTVMQNAQQEQGNRYSFAVMAADLDSKASKSLGLRYEDNDVKQGLFYVYRISVNHVDPETKTDTIELLVDFSGTTKDQKVTNCWVEPYDKEVTIAWTLSNGAYFTAYDIERSEDNKNWKKRNSRPYVSSTAVGEKAFMFIDTNLVNDKTYYYRLRGYTPFGEMGLYSDVMQSTPKDLTPPAPAFDIKAKDVAGAVMITWDAAPNEKDHDGFYVGRSALATGGFTKISKKLATKDRAFIDLQADPLNNNYYTVISVDKSGNEVESYVALGYIVDSIAPAPPTEVVGTIDTNGLVDITWARGPEADIIGYRVYWANDTISEFSQLTGDVVPNTLYRDSVNIRTLSEYSYYKVVAVDHRYNHSSESKILRLTKPDVVPPAMPVISKYTQGQLEVTFDWVNSNSTDVVEHVLERKTGNEDWKTINTFKKQESTFTEKDLKAGAPYAYRVVAVDDAGNRAMSKALEITAIDRGKRKGVEDFKITKQDGKSFLEWKYSEEGKYNFVIYSRDASNEFNPIGRVNSRDRKFMIQDANATYGIKVMYSDGGESPMATTGK